MGRPPLRSTGNVTKVESAIGNERRQTVRDLAEISGRGKPTVHRILKSDLKMSKASARWFLVYYRKIMAGITQLVTIVNFPTSLIVYMTCAGWSDL